MRTTVKIMLVDDHALVRQGIRSLLVAQPWIQVVGEAATGDSAIPLAVKLRPDVLLMDVHMPKGLDGLTATRRVREALPSTKILILTMFDEEPLMDRMLRAGANGILLKHDTSDEIIRAITFVCTEPESTLPFLPSSLAEEVRDRLLHRNRLHRDDESPILSLREMEVFTFIVNGYTNREIAERLHISTKTVEAHRAHIMERLGATSRADLVRYAGQNNLMLPGPRPAP